MLIVAACIAFLVMVLIVKGVIIIKQSETKIIERLGKYHKTLPTGINIIWPIIDQPRESYKRVVRSSFDGTSAISFKLSDQIELREQVYDFPGQSVITKDNVTTYINALLYFQITDPIKAVYEIDNLPNAIEKLTQTTLRNVIGELELDETLTSRDTINAKLRLVLDDATNKWGVKVNRVELQDITPPDSVRKAMEQQMQAERERRAKILKAEGEKAAAILESEGVKQSIINQAIAEKESQILRAQAEAEAKILAAKAEADSINNISASVENSKTDPASYMLAMKYIETLREMTSGAENKTVYMPYEASSMLSSLGSIKDIFTQK